MEAEVLLPEVDLAAAAAGSLRMAPQLTPSLSKSHSRTKANSAK